MRQTHVRAEHPVGSKCSAVKDLGVVFRGLRRLTFKGLADFWPAWRGLFQLELGIRKRTQKTMLEHLVVENLVLVDRVELAFGPGLNVLTGETGAGKSVLVRALSLILGGRAQLDAVRTGAEEAVVEALFSIADGSPLHARLIDRGIDVSDGALVVRRTLNRTGRGRVLLNGQMATGAMLAELLRGAVDVTSQHEHVSLLDPEFHLEMLDAYGGHVALRKSYEEAHAAVLASRAALSALDIDDAEKARREDYLRYALDEIRSVDPKLGELAALEEERERLRHASELLEGVRRAEGVLYSDEGAVVEAVGRVERELERLARLDARIASIGDQLRGVVAELEDLARGLSRYQGSMSVDPDRLGVVEDRLEQIRKLCRKHGGSVERVLEARSAFEAELDVLEHDEARRADLASILEAQCVARSNAARALSSARERAVAAFEVAVQTELSDLSMAGTRFAVTLRTLEEPAAFGAETAEFEISPNVGEPPRPLRKIASGGELSRILLALKRVLAGRGGVSTFVFDEVDTGIGGAVADVLGAKLKDVSTSAQVVCVTHLPQIAAYAERHFRVEKAETGGRTVTRLEALGEAASVEELARMLGGVEITDRTRDLARELRSRGRVAAPRSAAIRKSSRRDGSVPPPTSGPLVAGARRHKSSKPGRSLPGEPR